MTPTETFHRIGRHCPQELLNLPQWVNWAYETRGGKMTKIPKHPKGHNAKADDPTTWSTFEACAAVYAGGRFDGVGIVFSENDPYCGIDLDKCRDPGTGQIQPWAQKIIDDLAGYTEISPSRTGVKIWVKARKPGNRCRTAWPDGADSEIEIYDQKRYFTVTGDVLGEITTIPDKNEALTSLYSAIFEGSNTNGPLFSEPPRRQGRQVENYKPRTGAGCDLSEEGRLAALLRDTKAALLWNGGWEPYYRNKDGPDHSRADQALANKIAFYFGAHPAVIDKIFRQSGLYREKWEARADYRARTLDRAIQSTTEFYGSKTRHPSPRPSPTRGEGGSKERASAKVSGDSPGTAAADRAPSGPSALANHTSEPGEDAKGKAITVYIARHMESITNDLFDEKGADCGRVGGNLFHARDEADDQGGVVAFMDSPPALFGWLHAVFDEIRWKDNGLDIEGVSFVSKAAFFERVRSTAPAYAAVSAYPMHPPRKDMYVRWQPPTGYTATGTALETFLDFFNPASDADADLLAAFVLTLFWGGPAGARPLFIIAPEEAGSQQGIGKTQLVVNAARLVGGYMDLSAPKRGSFADSLSKQALEEVNLIYRVGLIDNHTGTIRDDDFTKLITAPKIGGRASYAKQAERANLITWAITTNEPNLSADIAARSAIIRLAPCNRENDPDWLGRLRAFLDAHGGEVAADCLDLLGRTKTPVQGTHSRYTDWDNQVLGCLEDPARALAHLLSGQRDADTDAEEIAEFLHALTEAHPTRQELRTKELAEVWNGLHTRDFSDAQVGQLLKNAAARGMLQGLSRKNRGNGSPWVWNPWQAEEAGRHSGSGNAPSTPLRVPPPSQTEAF